MQIVAVPLFDQEKAVSAYIFRYLKSNNLFSTAQATSLFDGASRSEALDVLDLVGLEAFTLGKPLFIPIGELMLLGDLNSQCKQPPEQIIFVLENPIPQESFYLDRILALRERGFRFAVNYPVNLNQPDFLLENSSYIFLSQRPERKEQSEQLRFELKRRLPNLIPIAAHIYTNEVLQSLYGKNYGMYESRFYRIKSGGNTVSPLKVNAIRLINLVQDEDFEFEKIAEIVQGDPALTISLMQIVNAQYGRSRKINSIRQAVAMMGQAEVRKWVTTAVSRSLGNDRPNEITRISLIRAKFAENLAPLFDIAHMSGELFLMGLFSVIDVILEKPMDEALKMVSVSDPIRNAILNKQGVLSPVLEMVTEYENASWSSISRRMLVHDIKEDALSEAYVDALVWYRNLINQSSQSPAEADTEEEQAEAQKV